MTNVASLLSPASSAVPSAKTRSSPADAETSDFETFLQGTTAVETGVEPSTQSPSSSADPGISEEYSAGEIAPPETEIAEATSNLELADESAAWPPLGLSALIMPPPQDIKQTPPAALIGLGLPSEAAPAATELRTIPPGSSTTLPAATALPTMMSTVAGAQPPTLTSPELTLSAAVSKELMADSAEPSALTSVIQGLTTVNLSRATADPNTHLAAPTPTPEFGSEGFDDAVGARVGWLADQKIGHAHIRITPHDMGTIEVRLQIDGDRVHASFNSAHAEVRQALEAGLGRLREMLSEQGLDLAQADVGQQSTTRDHATPNNQVTTDDASPGNTTQSGQNGMPVPLLLRQIGLLDTYA